MDACITELALDKVLWALGFETVFPEHWGFGLVFSKAHEHWAFPEPAPEHSTQDEMMNNWYLDPLPFCHGSPPQEKPAKGNKQHAVCSSSLSVSPVHILQDN